MWFKLDYTSPLNSRNSQGGSTSGGQSTLIQVDESKVTDESFPCPSAAWVLEKPKMISVMTQGGISEPEDIEFYAADGDAGNEMDLSSTGLDKAGTLMMKVNKALEDDYLGVSGVFGIADDFSTMFTVKSDSELEGIIEAEVGPGSIGETGLGIWRLPVEGCDFVGLQYQVGEDQHGYPVF